MALRQSPRDESPLLEKPAAALSPIPGRERLPPVGIATLSDRPKELGEEGEKVTLRQKRILFTHSVAKLLLQVNGEKCNGRLVEVAVDEWTVHSPRLVMVGVERVIAEDRVHLPGGRHSEGLAVDLLVYLDGEYVTSGEVAVWKWIDKKAKAIHPALSLGMEFHDANHLSWAEGDEKDWED